MRDSDNLADLADLDDMAALNELNDGENHFHTLTPYFRRLLLSAIEERRLVAIKQSRTLVEEAEMLTKTRELVLKSGPISEEVIFPNFNPVDAAALERVKNLSNTNQSTKVKFPPPLELLVFDVLNREWVTAQTVQNLVNQQYKIAASNKAVFDVLKTLVEDNYAESMLRNYPTIDVKVLHYRSRFMKLAPYSVNEEDADIVKSSVEVEEEDRFLVMREKVIRQAYKTLDEAVIDILTYKSEKTGRNLDVKKPHGVILSELNSIGIECMSAEVEDSLTRLMKKGLVTCVNSNKTQLYARSY